MKRVVIKIFLPGMILLGCILNVGIASAQQNPIVIEVGEQKVTLSEFNTSFKIALRMLAAQQGIALGNQDQATIDRLRTQYLGQRSGELSLIQEAKRRSISANDQDVLVQAAEVREKILADTSTDEPLDNARLLDVIRDKQLVALLSEQLLSEIVVRPGDVIVLHHDLAEEMQRPEQICLRHIVVDDESKASDLKGQLENGAEFEPLAKANSTDTKSAEKGGDMGCFAKEGLIGRTDFERASFKAGLNDLTGPVKSEFGYHLLVVYKRIPAHTPTLNEMYDELESEIRHEKLPVKLMDIRDASGEKTYPERLGTG
ncbi:MAG: peptidylprolyl isomerase [Gammaproteobacteria bacterium]|jgi:peptidyl-prolyl cis-trans isomerase C